MKNKTNTFDVCPHCRGTGDKHHHIDAGTIKILTCSQCLGTGKDREGLIARIKELWDLFRHHISDWDYKKAEKAEVELNQLIQELE